MAVSTGILFIKIEMYSCLLLNLKPTAATKSIAQIAGAY